MTPITEFDNPAEAFQHWLASNPAILETYMKSNSVSQSLVSVAFASGAIFGIQESTSIVQEQLLACDKRQVCTGYAERWLKELIKRLQENQYATLHTDQGMFIVRALNWQDDLERQIGAGALRNEEQMISWDQDD